MDMKPTPWLELNEILERDGHWTWRRLSKATGYPGSGFSHEYLRLCANGAKQPTPAVIRAMADVLKVPYSVLAPSPRDEDKAGAA